MDLVEVLKGVRQLGEYGISRAAVHLADVVSLQSVHEALGHAIRLRAAHRCMNRRDAQLSSDSVGFMGSIGAAIVCQELQTSRTGIDITEPCFDRFNQHLPYWFARQASSGPSSPRNDLAITAVLGEGARDGLTVLTCNLEAVRA